MTKHDNSHKKLFMKSSIVIIALITLCILFLTVAIYETRKAAKLEKALMDKLHRQKILIQDLSYSANRKAALLVADNLSSAESVNNLLIGAKNELAELFGAIKNSFEYESLIDRTGDELYHFSESIDVLINSAIIDENTDKAMSDINSHYEVLLTYFDDIEESILNYQNNLSQIVTISAISLFSLCAAALAVSIVKYYRNILTPLYKMYNDVRYISLSQSNNIIPKPIPKNIRPIANEINLSIEKLNMLIELIENINRNTSFEGILNYISGSFSAFIPYSHIGIALLKDDGASIEASYGISEPSINLKSLIGIKVLLSETSLGDVVKNESARIINDLVEYTKNSTALYNKIIVNAGIRASVTLPLKVNNMPIGIIFFSSTRKNVYNEEHVNFLKTISNSIAISFNQNIFIDELLYSSILALAKMAESRDEDTGEHLERMKSYAVFLTKCLDKENLFSDIITSAFIKDIERFSPMHDIGKVGIKDGILLKPGKLTGFEFEEIKKHAIYGAEILRTADSNIIEKYNRSVFKIGIDIAESHHERWDGTGYPYGKRGEDIPLSARIAALADVFDALTSKRPYKTAFTFEESLNIILKGRGSQFDPVITDVFFKYKDDLYRLCRSFDIDRSLSFL